MNPELRASAVPGRAAGPYPERFPGLAAALALTGSMYALARVSGCREFFFPELLALTIGCFWMGAKPWRVSRAGMLASLAVGGTAGVLLSWLPGMALPVKMLLGYAVCGVWLCGCASNFTPMYSACLLPLLLGEVSWFYPAVIVAEASVLCGLDRFREARTGAVAPPPPPDGTLGTRLFRLGERLLMLACLLSAVSGIGGYAAAPPLIVAFSVFADLRRPARRRLVSGVLACVFAAVLGVAGREFSLRAGVPDWAVLFAVVAIFRAFCFRVGYFLPPAGAILLLAFLIPENGLSAYLWTVPAGAVAFLSGGRLISLVGENVGRTGSVPVKTESAD